MQPGDSDSFRFPWLLLSTAQMLAHTGSLEKGDIVHRHFHVPGIFPFPGPIPSDTVPTERRLFSRQDNEAHDGKAPEDS